MPGCVSTEAANGTKTTISVFTARKINIEMIAGDNEFEAVHKASIPVHVEILGADKHEDHVERLIHTVKESTRCDFHNFPYKKCPKLMLVSSLEGNITWLNVLPKKNGISKTLNSSEIVLVTPKIDSTHATLQPRSYVHFKSKERSKNNMKTRSREAIKLRISNKGGGHYFMYVNTGCQLHSY